MALTERTRPYEILVRYNANAAGQLTIAAHQRDLTEVLRDGVVISATEGNATALDLNLVKDIVGQTLPGLLAERDALAAENADLQAQLDALAPEPDA